MDYKTGLDAGRKWAATANLEDAAKIIRVERLLKPVIDALDASPCPEVEGREIVASLTPADFFEATVKLATAIDEAMGAGYMAKLDAADDEATDSFGEGFLDGVVAGWQSRQN